MTGSKNPIKSEYILHGQVLETVTCARYLQGLELTLEAISHGPPTLIEL